MTRDLVFFNSILSVPESSPLSITVRFGKLYTEMVIVFVRLQGVEFDSEKEVTVTQSTLDAVAKQVPNIATKDMKKFFHKLFFATNSQIDQELLCLRIAKALMKRLKENNTIVQFDVFDVFTEALRPFDSI